MSAIIGLDFGNFNSYPCFIQDFDTDKRIGGQVRDLVPPLPAYQNGIPSVYYYTAKKGERIGAAALRSDSLPHLNRLRYLKRCLGKVVRMDDREVSIDKAITAVAQHCIRIANAQMQQNWQCSTNLVSLAYPASYTAAQRQRLIDLVEAVTLENGERVRVFGTVAEPAAAALDYLGEQENPAQQTTVLTYDLGGGTFDLGLVSAYPKGRELDGGERYYYDILGVSGIPNLGGREFDTVMMELLRSKIHKPLNPHQEDRLRDMATRTKELLSDAPDGREVVEFPYGDDYLEIPVTAEEFEEKAKGLLQRTIEKTRKMFQDHPNQKPDLILLSGGSSRMPMVKKALEEAFPQYRGKVISYRPAQAIAYGTARYGTVERNEELHPGVPEVQVVKRLSAPLGVEFHRNARDQQGHITTILEAGQEIPLKSSHFPAYAIKEGQKKIRFHVYEGKTEHPEPNQMEQDWTHIMEVSLEFGKPVPMGTQAEICLSVDALGQLQIEAWDGSQPDRPGVRNQVELKSLS